MMNLEEKPLFLCRNFDIAWRLTWRPDALFSSG
jgi:hypothetical protein